MDNVAKQQLIEQLKPVVNEPEFDSIFSALTSDISGPERFKLKAELRRLARPCRRAIDLRKRVDGHCRPYKHKGFVHYMDEVAIRIFEAGLEQYRGIYTEDTYEQVHNAENNFRIIAQRERTRALAAAKRRADSEQTALIAEEAEAEQPAKAAHLEVPYFTFGRYFHRKEERMNFSVQVMLKSTKGQNIEAMTTNISVSGMRVKVSPDYQFNIGEEVGVRFTGLAQEFTFDPNFIVPYRVVGAELIKDFVYLRLLRDVEFVSAEFDAFLVRFINGYKRRYKVNIDNTYGAIVTKGHEQFYFPRMSGVPLYFQREEKRMFASMALETENNIAVLDDWLNEDNQNQVPSLFTGKRLSRFLHELKENPGGIARTLFYTFQVLRQGKVSFYAATDFELAQDDDLKRVFLAYASRTNSFKVYSFSFSRLDVSKAWLPVTLPQDILDREKHLQRPPAPDVMRQLNGLTHVGLMTDITPAAERYQHYKCEREELVAIKPFAVSRKIPAPLQRVTYSFVNFRAESRFGYRTRVRVRHGDHALLGTSRDISTMGMQVDLEEPVSLKAGDFIELDLIQLTKRAQGFDLTHLRYELMHISKDKTTLHLRADVKVQNHQGRAYISEMIKNNQDEVLATRQSGTLHGLQLCLRNLYSHSMMSMPLYLNRPKGGEFGLGMLGMSPLNQPLKELCLGLANEFEHASLRPLMDDKQLQHQIRARWQKLDEKSRPQIIEMYVFMRYYKTGIQVERRYRSQFKSASFEHAFIKNALEQGCLMMLRLHISRTGKPDIAFIANEFKYVNLYAAHKAQQLEKDLWSVVGLVDVVDCTTELMNRLPMSKNAREQQAQRLDDFLAQL
ncbi:MAG: PilZ domain-containing protein [Idiomarina sp.]|nr:PilZ domain-containing protein [Idiomarina sp.]